MSSQWHGGKGSARRPENKEQFEENWDKIFGKKDYNTTEELDWETPETGNFGNTNFHKPIKEIQDNHPIRGKKV